MTAAGGDDDGGAGVDGGVGFVDIELGCGDVGEFDDAVARDETVGGFGDVLFGGEFGLGAGWGGWPEVIGEWFGGGGGAGLVFVFHFFAAACEQGEGEEEDDGVGKVGMFHGVCSCVFWYTGDFQFIGERIT